MEITKPPSRPNGIGLAPKPSIEKRVIDLVDFALTTYDWLEGQEERFDEFLDNLLRAEERAVRLEVESRLWQQLLAPTGPDWLTSSSSTTRG